MKTFCIRGENYHWIDNDRENRTDLCVHGHVTVTIGETEWEAEGTVSAAALLLLKSLTEDHTPGGDIQMIPCCGHFWCPDEKLENVTIIGCDTGLDWTITHENGAVRLTDGEGETVLVAYRDYLAEVLRFAESVERWYGYGESRILPEEPYERDGYTAFWNEWHRRYRDAAIAWMQTERAHTITETHSNARKEDLSEVHLHDCKITEILRDGDDLRFFLPEGITVMRWAECNSTGRYLQTGAAEIRLVGVQNPEAADAPQFEIISHRYDPKKGILTLDMYPGLHTRGVDIQKYKFICERVEYRFDEFAGDADLQIAAYLRLRDWTSEEGRKDYADILIEAMASEQRYDRQGNHDRTTYLLDLYDLFAAPEKERILRTVLDRHMQISCDNMSTYAPLLKGFADRGVTEAGEILEKLYNHYRTALENRTEPPDGYDELGSMVDLLAWVLDIHPPVWEQPITEQRPPEPPLTMETVIDRAENWTPPGTFHPARYRAFLKKQPPEKIAQLAAAAETAADPEVKARLYSLFAAVAYPGEPAEMIALLKERLDALENWVDTDDPVEKQRRLSAMCLVRALALLHHPAIRAMGLELADMSVQKEWLREPALALWCSNFDETTDIKRLLDFRSVLPKREENKHRHHGEDWAILHQLFRQKYEDPRMYGFLTDIFLHTYCSTCRHTAVKILAEHGMLQEAVRQRCLWDCEPETRKLAVEMEGKTV